MTPLNSFALSNGWNSSNVHPKQMYFTARAKTCAQLLKVIHVFQWLFRPSTLPSFNYLHTRYTNVFIGRFNLLASTESKLYLRFYLQAQPVKLHFVTENPVSLS